MVKAGKTKAKAVNYFDELMRQRDAYRKGVAAAVQVVNGEEVPLENNRMGLIRWYLHPAMEDTAIRNQLVWIQEIPPGSRSGKLKSQGGQINIVLEGRGYTMIDGVRYDWEPYDALFLPLIPEGTIIQHFNTDQENWARILGSEPNLFDAMGVDKGCGFEILEDSPDYVRGVRS